MDTPTNWKNLLKELKYDYVERTAPGFFAVSGGRAMKIKSYDDTTANGLTNCILDFLKYSGFYCNRINSQGQVRKERVQLAFGNHKDIVRFTKGTSNKGTADIDAIVFGRAVKIEVKVGRDVHSKYQKKEETRVTDAGGLYFSAKTFPSFLQWFNQTFKQ